MQKPERGLSKILHCTEKLALCVFRGFSVCQSNGRRSRWARPPRPAPPFAQVQSGHGLWVQHDTRMVVSTLVFCSKLFVVVFELSSLSSNIARNKNKLHILWCISYALKHNVGKLKLPEVQHKGPLQNRHSRSQRVGYHTERSVL